MVLTRQDIAQAARKRRTYEVDDQENFTSCALAQCLSKMSGAAKLLVMRRYAFIAFPDEEVTWRYQMDSATRRIVHQNDAGHLDEILANTPVSFLPPTPGRRLDRQGGRRVSKRNRGILANPPRPATPDPYRGIYRNGVHAPVANK
jgi:hypothetical protein